tara:strand:+ start:126 stop:395 length:270 start_codon:yes stop_codon:yes gene_type:complete
MNELDILVTYIDQYKVIKQKYFKYKKLNDNIFFSWFYNKEFKKTEMEYNNIRYYLMLRYVNNPNILNMSRTQNINPIKEYDIPVAQQIQ